MIKSRFDSLSNAINGLKNVWKEEFNFRIEIFSTVVVLFAVYYFRFSIIESALSIIAITIVLSAEIVNTAIEDICNKIEPHHDEVIGKIKDTAGAFVLVSAIGAFIIGSLVIYSHFF